MQDATETIQRTLEQVYGRNFRNLESHQHCLHLVNGKFFRHEICKKKSKKLGRLKTMEFKNRDFLLQDGFYSELRTIKEEGRFGLLEILVR